MSSTVAAPSSAPTLMAATAPTPAVYAPEVVQRQAAKEAAEQAAEAAALNWATWCAALINVCMLAISVLGSIAVFGVGIWLVTSFDSSTDNFKGGIAAIVLGGIGVFALTCVLLVVGCGLCVGWCAYNKELNKQKNAEKTSELKDSSDQKKPANVV